jgi:hypothetical protein
MKNIIFIGFLFFSLQGIGQPLIDSYIESNWGSTYNSYTGLNQSLAESFYCQTACTLTSVKVYLKSSSSPPGNCYVKIYAASYYSYGYGPTGSVLATSDAVANSSLTGSYALKTFTFSGANAISLTAPTVYSASFVNNNASTYGWDQYGTGSHVGTYQFLYSSNDESSWSRVVNQEGIFYVYGTTPSGVSILLFSSPF